MSVEGERGVDTGKRFRCVAIFAHSKGKGRKERKKEVEHLDRHPFIYNIIREALLVTGCTLNFLRICKAHCTVSIINNLLTPKILGWQPSNIFFVS